MAPPALNFIFNLCVLLGLVIPLLNIFTGWFGDMLNADFDFDADIDMNVDLDADLSGSGGSIPFNVMCLCLFLVVFGVAGHVAKRWMQGGWSIALLLALCLALAAAFYVLLYRLVILRLKRNRPYAESYADLAGRRGEVSMRITPDALGTIRVRDSTGAFLSFRAKIDPDLAPRMPAVLPPGTTVVVTEADVREKLCYVSTLVEQYVQPAPEGTARVTGDVPEETAIKANKI